ncbi:piggyBac transposable element-derived protein 3-like isoform X1 [Diabrotica virgifera virgifera]|uniref:PiggyBac transposable element-derived protein domain-containing protein n=1 Tax=Diabrotica virgifera virgifera TaxID=50390 RepID=A0ABM5KB43_DIAVI|nr:piggyBac transposable element-derived protein 3-like isoform X1 [Diabrotica virgifera virgifera]
MKSIPIEQHLSVDKQIIRYKGRSGLKQYNPKKPKKWGYKLFCLAGASGIVYDFEVYCGAHKQPDDLPDISASINVVIRLAERIPKNQNFLLFYDNWFCSPELQIKLSENGIQSLGTVRTNRVPKNKLPADKVLMKQGRGSCVEKVAVHNSTTLRVVKWYDNKAVTLLSTFASASPETTVQRYDRKKKESVTIKCPSIIILYNKFMGGVDLIDSLLALYRTKIRSRKYYLRIFFHLMDMSVIIAWLMYRRASDDCGIPKRQLSLYDFKADVAQSLCWASKLAKRGRPSGSTPSLDKKKIKTCVSANADCIADRMDHWPHYEKKTGRCKNKKCQKITKVKCTKCNCFLCFVPDRNCFLDFHQ